MHWLLANLAAEQPIALLVDDFQWADGVSREWLGFTARRLESTAVCVLVTIRSGDAASFSQALLDPAARIIRPSPLAQAGAGELLEQTLGRPVDASFTQACVEATGGNPFLLQELARALARQQIPPDHDHAPRVGDVISERLELFVSARMASVPDAAAALARAVALLGADSGAARGRGPRRDAARMRRGGERRPAPRRRAGRRRAPPRSCTRWSRTACAPRSRRASGRSRHARAARILRRARAGGCKPPTCSRASRAASAGRSSG